MYIYDRFINLKIMFLISQIIQERLCFPLLQDVASYLLELEMSLLKPSLIKHLLWHYKPVLYTVISELRQKRYFYIFKFWFEGFKLFYDNILLI